MIGIMLMALALVSFRAAFKGRRRNQPLAFDFLIGKREGTPSAGLMQFHTWGMFALALLSEIFALLFFMKAVAA